MKRHKFTKWNKERISVYTSAALVVGVCVLSGIYAVGQTPSKTQILDMESIDESSPQESAQAEAGDINPAPENPATEPDQVILTSGATDSTMLTSPTLAQEYAKRADEERKKHMPDSADLTGDAELSEEAEEAVISTKADSKSKAEEPELRFNPEDGMTWPVQGNVILNYSMDERAYLATLNEYRYYPAIAISASTDTPVCAAARGKIDKIGFNEEIGQYLIVNMGDGYTVTYGQLKDITVQQGDTVSRGQIIGYLADPTKYYAIEGTNLYVKMEHEGDSMNPVLYFQ